MINVRYPTAQETNARATTFLERREFEPWSERNEQELTDWLAESKAHRAAFWRLEAAWERTHRLAALKPKQLEPYPRTEAPQTFRWLRMAAGAAAIVVIGVTAGIYTFWPREAVYQTQIGGRETIRLADGSQIELNTGTVLRTHITRYSRAVTLVRGEAYFRIRHNPSLPFVVTTSGGRVTDLGTVFTVRNDAGTIRVTLLEGKAQFDAGGKPVVLAPGDKAVATANVITVSHDRPQALMTDLGWRRGVVIFKRTTLAEVAAEFNRYNDTKLVIADAETARLTVGGTFPANNIELFGRMASAILGLHVVQRRGQIVISR